MTMQTLDFRNLSRMILDLSTREPQAVDPTASESEKDMLALYYVSRCATDVSYPPVRFVATDNLVERLAVTDFPTGELADLKLPFEGFVVKTPASCRSVGKPVKFDRTMTADGITDYWIVAKNRDDLVIGEATVDPLSNDIRARAFIIDGKQTITSEMVNKASGDLGFLMKFLAYLSTDLAEHSISGKTYRGAGCGVVVLPPIRAKHRNKRGGISHKEVTKRTVRVGASVKPFVAHANTLVRGHFKRQPYGPRNSLRKVIWVEPHLRFKDESFPVLGKDVIE